VDQYIHVIGSRASKQVGRQAVSSKSEPCMIFTQNMSSANPMFVCGPELLRAMGDEHAEGLESRC